MIRIVFSDFLASSEKVLVVITLSEITWIDINLKKEDLILIPSQSILIEKAWLR